MPSLRYLVAARYIRSRKSHSVINIISGVSVMAMATPVAAMIVLLSVFNGLEGMVRQLYRAVDPDITVTPAEGTTFAVADVDTAALRAVGGVEALSFVLEQGAMAEAGGRMTITSVKGVDGAYADVVPIAGQVFAGTFTVALDEQDCIVAGHGVAQELQLSRQATGAPVRLYAINRARISSLLPVGGYTRREMPVAGIYAVDEQTGERVLTSLRAAQRLFNYPGRASGIEVRVAEGADADAVARRLQAAAGEGMRVLTREQGNSIYRLMALEKWGVFLVAALVLAVASLSIVGTLVMVIIDKRDEIRTLRTMGADSRLVRGIFTGEGELLAAVSLVAGLAAGVLLTLAQQYWGVVRIDAQTLMIDAYPVELHLADVLLTAAAYSAVAWSIVRLTVNGMLNAKQSI